MTMTCALGTDPLTDRALRRDPRKCNRCISSPEWRLHGLPLLPCMDGDGNEGDGHALRVARASRNGRVHAKRHTSNSEPLGQILHEEEEEYDECYA